MKRLMWILMAFLMLVPCALCAEEPEGGNAAEPKGETAGAAQPVAAKADQPVAAKADKSPSGIVNDEMRQQIVNAVQDYYNKAFSYSAQFKQVYETVDGIKTESSGVVWFKKPGLMRWDYEKPEMRFLLSDGENFWSWEPIYRQYCKQPLKAAQLPTALTFLAGEGRIEDDFNVSVQSVLGNQVTLELLPKVPTSAYSKIHFKVILPRAKVYQVRIFDAMGNENLITFESPELNGQMESKLFSFTPPADAVHICK